MRTFEAHSTAEAPRPIEYAPPRPLWKRRTFAQRVVLGLSVAVGLVATWRLAPPLWHRIVLVDAQRRCLNAIAPPDRVVYDDDLLRGQPLLKTDPRYQLVGTVPVVAWCSTDWQRFQASARPPGGTATPTLFLGERRSADGDAKLVVIEAWRARDLYSPTAANALYFEQEVITPGTLSTPPMLSSHSFRFAFTFEYDPKFPVRLFAGQADPADASHFTIDYEANGSRGVIDGWLRENGVRLERRALPTSSPATIPSPG